MAKARSPFADPTRPRKSEVRLWQEGYRRAAERQRALATAEGFDQGRATALALDVLDAGLPASAHTPSADAVRVREAAAVRAVWRRLRAGLMQPS